MKGLHTIYEAVSMEEQLDFYFLHGLIFIMTHLSGMHIRVGVYIWRLHSIRKPFLTAAVLGQEEVCVTE